MTNVGSDPLVSIQQAGVPDPVAGHLSWGVVWDVDVVLVPGPFGWLGTERLEVLVARDDRVLRVSPWTVTLMGVEENRDGAVALVQLAAAVLDPLPRPFDPDVLDTDIRVTGDVWTALERQRAVPDGLRSRPAGDLAVVVAWERLLRGKLVRDLVHPQYPPTWPKPWCILNPRNCEPGYVPPAGP